MAYADFTFYGSGYFGDTLTEETAPKWLERAKDPSGKSRDHHR